MGKGTEISGKKIIKEKIRLGKIINYGTAPPPRHETQIFTFLSYTNYKHHIADDYLEPVAHRFTVDELL